MTTAGPVPAVLRSTQLPLPPASAANALEDSAQIRAFARPPHDAAYWGDRMRGRDFSRSDHADTARFNRVLWAGLKGEDVAYPFVRSGRNLRAKRKQLLQTGLGEPRHAKSPAGVDPRGK